MWDSSRSLKHFNESIAGSLWESLGKWGDSWNLTGVTIYELSKGVYRVCSCVCISYRSSGAVERQLLGCY